MKAKVVYIEHEKAKRINELLKAEKEFLALKTKNKIFLKNKRSCILV